jgi:ubiquinone/menaquinone biosynthesis C-methylase UbiE
LGCNVGRNLFWLKRALGLRVRGFDVNAATIDEGHRYFGLTDTETTVGGVEALHRLESGSHDVAFTISVLDHIPDPEIALRELLRVAARRVLLVELTLPAFGVVDDPRCVGCSYSHDYDALLARPYCRVVSKRRTPLGEGTLQHYTTFELEAVQYTAPL